MMILRFFSLMMILRNFFHQLQSYDDVWIWLVNNFLTRVFPKPCDILNDNRDNVFLIDRTSKVVNGIRIRQIRVKASKIPLLLNLFLLYIHQFL